MDFSMVVMLKLILPEKFKRLRLYDVLHSVRRWVKIKACQDDFHKHHQKRVLT